MSLQDKSLELNTKLTGIADAIRSKTGNSDKLTLDTMKAEIESIQTGGDGEQTIMTPPPYYNGVYKSSTGKALSFQGYCSKTINTTANIIGYFTFSNTQSTTVNNASLYDANFTTETHGLFIIECGDAIEALGSGLSDFLNSDIGIFESTTENVVTNLATPRGTRAMSSSSNNLFLTPSNPLNQSFLPNSITKNKYGKYSEKKYRDTQDSGSHTFGTFFSSIPLSFNSESSTVAPLYNQTSYYVLDKVIDANTYINWLTAYTETTPYFYSDGAYYNDNVSSNVFKLMDYNLPSVTDVQDKVIMYGKTTSSGATAAKKAMDQVTFSTFTIRTPDRGGYVNLDSLANL